MTTTLDIVAVIDDERKRQGMTVTALADAVGCARPRLSRILNRHVEPGATTVAALMGALGLKIAGGSDRNGR